jgi:drug/metabolite transporter (DMT)-like permease
MLGYLFLALALLAGVVKGYCGKKSGGTLVLASDAMLVNTVRMLACILIGLALIALGNDWSALTLDVTVLWISALSGICTALFVVSWLLSIRTGAFMMVDVFLLMGVLIPLIVCAIFFDEPIIPIQWVGIAVLIIAGYVMCSYNAKLKGKLTLKAFFMLLLCAASYGCTDLSQKLFVNLAPTTDNSVFQLYTYIFAALTLVVCSLIFRSREKKTNELRSPIAVVKPIAIYVGVMAICLYANSYFKTAAATYLDAAQIYPLSQGGSLVLAMIMAAIFFKEKITLRSIIGVALCAAALLMINLPALQG